jgi:SAM-dependent methyltransferase
MNSSDPLPALYRQLAGWFPVLTPPEEYAEEAGFYTHLLQSACTNPPRTLLELGSGGGHNASHMKAHFQMTLVDLSPDMLAVSRKLNPDCEHFQGDMRSVRLGRQFDAVFIHDAIAYMLSEDDLFRAIETAYVHCKPGGAALFTPDDTRETFQPSTDHGGSDQGSRSLRYIEWDWDPDPSDTTYISDMAYLMREGDGEMTCFTDRHVCGLFGQADWLRIIAAAGFQASMQPFEHSDLEPGSVVFLGRKLDRLE